MLHSTVLKHLLPLELGLVSDSDLALEGALLDAVAARLDALLLESFPDTTSELVADWERICDITPPAGSTLQNRRNAIVRKLRETGGLSIAYFTALAASMGYTITIDEPYIAEGKHAWRITFQGRPIYEFRADESCAEELLLDWDVQTAAEGIFEDLKPAHSRLIFAYA